jgi:hypothetical protein
MRLCTRRIRFGKGSPSRSGLVGWRLRLECEVPIMSKRADKNFYQVNSYIAGLVTALAMIVVWQFCAVFAFLEKWQTLVAGVIATLAAIATVRAIHLQIAQTAKLAKKASRRKNWAARALIAGPLSRICAVELDLRKKLFDERGKVITGSQFEGEIVWETLSDREVDLLARCIVDAEPRAAKDLSALLSELQIHQARLESEVSIRREVSLIVTQNTFESLALDSVFIAARAQRLFLYSRREDGVYFAKPMSKPVFEQHWRELDEFQLEAAAKVQIDNAEDKWLAPICQRSPL